MSPCESCVGQGILMEDMVDGRQIVSECQTCHGSGEV